AAAYSDRTGVYVGSGGGNYESQYDYFPLLTAAQEKLPAFGQELSSNVNPMWLLRTLPNNVLGHIGIRHGFKGANACITNHSIGGTLAVIEAMEALRTGEADRALAVGHDAPIEPQMVLYYHAVGLLATDAGIRAAEVGMIAAHGNGTLQSDASEAAAIRRVFGASAPPATAFKWAFGHLIAAAGIIETVLALESLRRRTVPGIATFAVADP